MSEFLWTPRSAPASGLDGNGPVGVTAVALSWGPQEVVPDASYGRSENIRFVIYGPAVALRCEYVVLPPKDDCRAATHPRRRVA
jgi:hypothetical protein